MACAIGSGLPPVVVMISSSSLLVLNSSGLSVVISRSLTCVYLLVMGVSGLIVFSSSCAMGRVVASSRSVVSSSSLVSSYVLPISSLIFWIGISFVVTSSCRILVTSMALLCPSDSVCAAMLAMACLTVTKCLWMLCSICEIVTAPWMLFLSFSDAWYIVCATCWMSGFWSLMAGTI